jgi:hypothetical protein
VGAAVIALSGLIAYFLITIPAVKGLGSKVKLPLFHGASTWVDLLLFTLMGVTALLYIVGGRKDGVYAWAVGFRAIAAPLWLINSVLGFVAALNTWDFTGSKESPLVSIRQDPRLMAQVILLLAVGILLLLDWLVLEKRLYKAIADVVFVGVMWALLGNVFLDPAKRALHPDSPVLNSGWEIKGPFFGIVVSILAIALILVWLVSRYVAPDRQADVSDASREGIQA